MQLTWPSQRNHLWLSKANILSYTYLPQDLLVWDAILPGDTQNPPKAAQVEGVEFLVGIQISGFAAVEQRAEHAGFVNLHLVPIVSMESSQTLFPSGVSAITALPIRLFSSVSREMLLEIVEPR